MIHPKQIKELNQKMFELLIQRFAPPITDTAEQLAYIRQAKEILTIDGKLKELGQCGANALYFAVEISNSIKALFNELDYTEPNVLKDKINAVFDDIFIYSDMGYRNLKAIKFY